MTLKLAPLLLLLTGCAGYDLTALSRTDVADHHKKQKEGYIFYEPAPYLIATLKAPSSDPNAKAPPADPNAKAPASDPNAKAQPAESNAKAPASDPNAKAQPAESNAKVSQLALYDYKLVYLPNHSRPYRFTRYEFLAKSDLKITFEDGWKFTGAEATTDTTGLLSAVTELAKAVPGALARPSDQARTPSLILYKIDLSTDLPQITPVGMIY